MAPYLIAFLAQNFLLSINDIFMIRTLGHAGARVNKKRQFSAYLLNFHQEMPFIFRLLEKERFITAI
ncbi:hypothetical protein HNR39_002814 [Glaciimonas immobilis]|uniref:Uncharacterized protein n=1 Tax=Glaciimonas immobilis TaxID=728004 RepID=A0A840RUX7_9BURK|nr:hypothetical protein [Glaciimonas immobilis]